MSREFVDGPSVAIVWLVAAASLILGKACTSGFLPMLVAGLGGVLMVAYAVVVTVIWAVRCARRP